MIEQWIFRVLHCGPHLQELSLHVACMNIWWLVLSVHWSPTPYGIISYKTLSQDQLTLQHMQYAFLTYPSKGSKIVVRMFKERVVVTVAELRLK